MDVREKLVEIIIKSGEICYSHTAEELASHLIDHGVTVQEFEGCEFCNAEYAEWSEGASHDFRIKGNALYYYDDIYGWEGTIVYHCPMCGRRLPQPPKGE